MTVMFIILLLQWIQLCFYFSHMFKLERKESILIYQNSNQNFMGILCCQIKLLSVQEIV
jgi:hypothetical protein